jgi:hypothetical protein
MLPLRIGLFLGLALALVGCSKPGASSRVTGVVTYKGQVVPAGELYFVYDEGGQYNTALKPDGSYQFVDVPAGAAKVLIDTEGFNPDQKPKSYTQKGGYASKMGKNLREYDAVVGKGDHPGGTAGGKAAESPTGTLTKEQRDALAKQYVKIPRKYASEKTSTLTVTVDWGAQVKNFDLTD